MNVSLIIPTLNNESSIGECLKSLKKQLSNGDEVILVDSYSKDDTVKVAKKYKPIIVQKKCNRSKARNIGWRKAKNDVIIFIESDSIYKKDYIKTVKKRMQNKKIMCLLDKREHYKPSTWVSKTLQKEFEIRHTKDFEPPNPWIIRKDALESVNGFDENLEYAEDADLGIRLKEKGYKIIFERKAVQYHLGEPKTLKEVVKRSWDFGSNMKKFYNKHKNPPSAKITLFLLSLIYFPFLIVIFVVNLARYEKLSFEYRVKLSFISILRNIVFSISYMVSLL